MSTLQLRGFLAGLLESGSRRSKSAKLSARATRFWRCLPGSRTSLLCLLLLLLGLPSAIPLASAQNKKKAATPAAVAQPRVAVLYFDYSGNDEEMSFLKKGMAQMLVTDLSATGELQVVERIDLEAILKELKLGRTNKVNPRSRNKIGKLLGARYLITGGYFQFKNSLRVDAKIIDVERGTTKSFAAQGKPDDFMEIESALTVKLHAALVKLGAANARTSNKKPRKIAKDKLAKSPAVTARTVARYGRALDALDQGKKQLAASGLESVAREAPHFKPAVDDLRVLLR